MAPILQLQYRPITHLRHIQSAQAEVQQQVTAAAATTTPATTATATATTTTTTTSAHQVPPLVLVPQIPPPTTALGQAVTPVHTPLLLALLLICSDTKTTFFMPTAKITIHPSFLLFDLLT